MHLFQKWKNTTALNQCANETSVFNGQNMIKKTCELSAVSQTKLSRSVSVNRCINGTIN